MPYEYFEVTAEVGLRAWGGSYEEAFSEGARGLFELMINTQAVQTVHTPLLQVRAESIELLFADWLNLLIVERDRSGLVFSDFKIKIIRQRDHWELSGLAGGEPLDRQRHDPRIDVKAVTYHQLRSDVRAGVFTMECVLDI